MIVKPGIPDELRWFYRSRFGMFVHFGISSILGRGEWVMYRDDIPREDYEKHAAQFNPTEFGAADWVGLARDAGARYMTVTAKHHDGFCLFDSKLTDFTSVNTPFGRDIIGELADECAKQSIPLVLYYSQPDWHHPNFVHNRGAFKDLDNPPVSDEPDWEKYLEFYFGQVEELMKQYEPAGIWFDGSHKTEAQWRGRDIYELIKSHNPKAIVNDRGRYGDMFTPERSLPEDLTGYLFEACQSVSKQAWGYREDSTHFSVPDLIRSLQRTAGAGGNYLLNVGPRPDGSIDETQRAIMLAIGRWLEAHGEAIYDSEPVDLGGAAKDSPEAVRLTGRGSTAYVHVLDWPDTDRIRIPAARLGSVSSVTAVGAAGDAADLSAFRENGELEIRLPPEPWQALPAVVRLELDGPVPLKSRPPVERPATWPLAVGPGHSSGELVLEPRDLARIGRGPKGKRVEPAEIPGYGHCLGGWMDGAQSVSFAVDLEMEGAETGGGPGGDAGAGGARLELFVDIAVPRGMDDGVLAIDVDGAHVADIELVGSYENEPQDSARGSLSAACARDFAEHHATIEGLSPGRHEVLLYPGRLHWGYLFGFVGRIRVVARRGR